VNWLDLNKGISYNSYNNGGNMVSKYIKQLIKDYRNINMKSFLDKHGAEAVALAKKMSERQKHEQRIDSQVSQ